MNENQKIAKIVEDKSIFHEEFRDLIYIMPIHAEEGEHWYKNQRMMKLNEKYDIFNKLENVNSRFENAFFEKFNEIFLVSILQRLRIGIRSNVELFETIAKSFNGKQYDECSLYEKINALKKAIGDKFEFKICFFCLYICPLENTEIICYDLFLKEK